MLVRMACKKQLGARSMIMKPTVITLVVAVWLFRCTAASAGSVEIGLVNDAAGFDRWLAGGPAKVPTREVACRPAKFREISSCGTLVISNRSSQAITVSFDTGSEEFWTGWAGAFGVAAPPNVPLPCSAMNVRGLLQPGKSCYEKVSFWPWTGDVSHGTIHVIVEIGSGSATTDYMFKGTSDYPPKLQKAEQVRQRHQAQLKKIQHVASVELDEDAQDRIKINVTVADKEDIEDVRRQVPPQIEGYDTEVTQHIGHAVDL